MILGSKATFAYNPTTDEIKQYIAKKKGQKVKDYSKYVITDAEKEEGKRALIAAENSLPIEKRNTVGDASETGIIKFA